MQESLVRKRAAELGGRFVQTWADEFVSATDVRWAELVEFQKLMGEIQPGDHLIVWRLDPLDGSPLGTVGALEWLFDRGVSVHVLEYGGLQVDLDAQSGRLLTTILAEFARLLVEFRPEAVRQSIRWRKERGLAYNKMPELGKCRRYTYTARDGKRARVGFDIWDPADCDIMREIWRRHELEGETLYSIARDLKARDVRRWDARPWVPDGCRRQRGTGKRYPLNSRCIQRAFWRYTAMLAQGCDLQDMEPPPQDVQRAIRRLTEHRLRWTKKGQPGRLPKEVRDLLERSDLEALSEVTPRSSGRDGFTRDRANSCAWVGRAPAGRDLVRRDYE